MDLYDELVWRGLIYNTTSPDLKDKLNQGGLNFYIGIDPTADSLHIGHYSSLSAARRLAAAGHHPIILVGGATGFIGDPKESGERSLLSKEDIAHNYAALYDQIQKLFGFEMVNNLDWTEPMSIIDFLRDIGKDFNVTYMLNKETVRKRLESGVSYTEFSYMLLQALDFLRLFENKQVTLQIGGQDQWGNITAGLELIRKKHGEQVYGLTMPLITNADGTKFGKSESGTVWLDGIKTSPYQLYQFLLNTEDEKVIEYIKKLTFLTVEEIEALEKSHLEKPFQKEAHKALAYELVKDVHGKEKAEEAVKISQAIFKGNVQDLEPQLRKEVLLTLPHVSARPGKLEDLLVESGIARSKREAREWIKGNSIAINGIKHTDPNEELGLEDAYCENALLVKRGKRNIVALDLTK